MNTMTRLLAVACLALSFTACKKEEAPVAAETAAPLTAPATDDLAAWRNYITEVAKRNMGGINNSPYVYFLPGEGSEDFAGQYDRQLEKLEQDLGRGILEGNMLVFASPSSAKETEMVEAAFSKVPPGSMKGVRVVFVGKVSDGQRVKAAVEPAGVNYVFVDTR